MEKLKSKMKDLTVLVKNTYVRADTLIENVESGESQIPETRLPEVMTYLGEKLQFLEGFSDEYNRFMTAIDCVDSPDDLNWSDFNWLSQLWYGDFYGDEKYASLVAFHKDVKENIYNTLTVECVQKQLAQTE